MENVGFSVQHHASSVAVTHTRGCAQELSCNASLLILFSKLTPADLKYI